MNIDVLWWWMIFLLPLIYVIRLIPRVRQISKSIYYPFDEEQLANTRKNKKSNIAIKTLLTIAWVLLILASTRPQIYDERTVDTQYARNIVLAVDISESMLERDMIVSGRRVNRLQALKKAINEFIDKREGDQIGLIVFADNAYVLSPLTYDLDTVKELVKKLQVGLAGKRTSIGDALVLSIKVLDSNPLVESNNASIILLSDGANTWGKVSPLDAQNLAKNKNYKVHTIGFGSNRFGSALDERTLHAIAQNTKGQYYRATNAEQLRQVYNRIDELNRIEIESYSYKQTKEIYYIPLLGFILVIVVSVILYYFNNLRKLIAEGE